MKPSRSRPRAPAICLFFVFLVLLFLYSPILLLFFDSLKFDGAFSLHWYQAVIDDDYLRAALIRSLSVAFLSSSFAVVIGGLTVLTLYKTNFFLNPWLKRFVVTSLTLPEIVFALALLNWFFILSWSLSLVTVTIAHTTLTICYVVFIASHQAQKLDIQLENAARDLGASELQVWTQIILPLMSPAFMGGFLLSFIISFDDFLMTFYSSGVGQDTLPIALYSAMRFGLSPKLSALASIMFFLTLPLVYWLFQWQQKSSKSI